MFIFYNNKWIGVPYILILVTQSILLVICVKMEIETSTKSTLIFHPFIKIVFKAS